MTFGRHLSFALALIMITTMAVIAYATTWNNSPIYDETAHIGAGYAYLTERDMRLNPEHPPLVKNLAAFPLVFLDLNFPTDTEAWQNQLNGQWDQGGNFLFEFGNNPETIVRAARAPIVLLAVLCAFLLFFWARHLYGNRVAVLAVFFFAFSPTVLAHSGLVTTDIAAAVGFLAGIAMFVKFLQKPTRKNILLTGIVFGVVQLLKFSLFLLVPFYIFLATVWLISTGQMRHIFGLGKKVFAIFGIGVGIIWIGYTWHVWDYPLERQLQDAKALTSSFRAKPIVDLELWLTEQPLTRPLGQYLLGVMMVTQRTAGGNSAYFMGEVAASGWPEYFPTVYLMKETLGFHILSLLALIIACMRIVRAKEKSWRATRAWTAENFPLFASLAFVAYYWLSSVTNPLNIGVRHVLPTFPFLYMLVSRELVIWTSHRTIVPKRPRLSDIIASLYRMLIAPIPKILLVSILCLWIFVSVILAYPHYLSYYNALAGGTRNGYYIATDSNYDWGQDLKRLSETLKNYHGTIYLDYFGGSSPNHGAQYYYLGSRYKAHYSSFGPPPSGSIFAISINQLMGNLATPVKGFPPHKPENTYSWLRDLTPIGRGGTSILIFRMP